MRHLTPATALSRRTFLTLLALAAFAASPAVAVPRYFPLEGSRLGDTLVLDPDRVIIVPHYPEGNRYEQSGDYKERKQPYRVAAYESYYARIGRYEGVAHETFVERRAADDPPTLLEADVTIVVGTPEGDSAQIQFAIPSIVWYAGFGGMENTWTQGENVNTNPRYLVTLAGVDPGMRKDYPWPDEDGPTAIRTTPRRLVLQGSASGLRLEPPEWARGVSIHSLTGGRIFAAPLLPGKPLELPSRLNARGAVYVRYF